MSSKRFFVAITVAAFFVSLEPSSANSSQSVEQLDQQAEVQRLREAHAQAEAEIQYLREAAEAETERHREVLRAVIAEAAAEVQRLREAHSEAEAAMQRHLAGEAQQAPQAVSSFINSVRRAVESELDLSKYQGQNLRATVQVVLSTVGELERVNLITESGSHEFDYSAVVAIQNAAPFSEIRDLPEEQRRNVTRFNLSFASSNGRERNEYQRDTDY